MSEFCDWSGCPGFPVDSPTTRWGEIGVIHEVCADLDDEYAARRGYHEAAPGLRQPVHISAVLDAMFGAGDERRTERKHE